MMLIRNTVKAIVRRNKSILMLRKSYENGRDGFTLPGGSQNPGETLIRTLERECYGEICEYEKASEKPRKPPRHKVEFGFECEVPPEYRPRSGPLPDLHQTEVLWIELSKLGQLPLNPSALTRLIGRNRQAAGDVYQGLVR